MGRAHGFCVAFRFAHLQLTSKNQSPYIYAKNVQEKEKDNVKITLTVKELLLAWIESISINVKKSTIDTYMLIINNHIIPFMGNTPVYMITTEFLNNFTSEKISSGRMDGTGGLVPKTVQNIIGVLKAAFKYAEKIYGMKNPLLRIICVFQRV